MSKYSTNNAWSIQGGVIQISDNVLNIIHIGNKSGLKEHNICTSTNLERSNIFSFQFKFGGMMETGKFFFLNISGVDEINIFFI